MYDAQEEAKYEKLGIWGADVATGNLEDNVEEIEPNTWVKLYVTDIKDGNFFHGRLNGNKEYEKVEE